MNGDLEGLAVQQPLGDVKGSGLGTTTSLHPKGQLPMLEHRGDQGCADGDGGNDHRGKKDQQRGQKPQHRSVNGRNRTPQVANDIPRDPLEGGKTPNGEGHLGKVVLGKSDLDKGFPVKRQKGISRWSLLSRVQVFRIQRIRRNILTGEHGAKGVGLVPRQGVDREFSALRTGGVDPETSHAKEPLQKILFHMDGLDTFEGDVGLVADQDAFSHLKLAFLDAKCEPGEMQDGCHKGHACQPSHGPKKEPGFAVPLEIKCNQQRPRHPQDQACLQAQKEKKPKGVLALRSAKAIRGLHLSHGFGFPAGVGCSLRSLDADQEFPNWRLSLQR